MTRLPCLMVAPNGASRTKADHPALPITLDEIVETARACHAAGADGLHLHLRDAGGRHLLDTAAYRAACARLANEVPGLAVQITTEAGGRYAPDEQMRVARTSGAGLVSVAIRELLRGSGEAAQSFYAACRAEGIAVQHILYDVEDCEALARLLPAPVLADPALQLLFVLGRYTEGQRSAPRMLRPFVEWMRLCEISPDWAICAFGPSETDCLVDAHEQGGKLRVGFENAFYMRDGTLAPDNAARVAEVARATGRRP